MFATWSELEDRGELEGRWTGLVHVHMADPEAAGYFQQSIDIERAVEWMGDEPMVTLTWADATDSGTDVFYGLAEEAEAWWAELERTLEGDGPSLAATFGYLRDGAFHVGQFDAAGLGDRWRGWQILRSARIWGYGRG